MSIHNRTFYKIKHDGTIFYTTDAIQLLPLFYELEIDKKARLDWKLLSIV